jgi:hypothetical protein
VVVDSFSEKHTVDVVFHAVIYIYIDIYIYIYIVAHYKNMEQGVHDAKCESMCQPTHVRVLAAVTDVYIYIYIYGLVEKQQCCIFRSLVARFVVLFVGQSCCYSKTYVVLPACLRYARMRVEVVVCRCAHTCRTLGEQMQ